MDRKNSFIHDILQTRKPTGEKKKRIQWKNILCREPENERKERNERWFINNDEDEGEKYNFNPIIWHSMKELQWNWYIFIVFQVRNASGFLFHTATFHTVSIIHIAQFQHEKNVDGFLCMCVQSLEGLKIRNARRSERAMVGDGVNEMQNKCGIAHPTRRLLKYDNTYKKKTFIWCEPAFACVCVPHSTTKKGLFVLNGILRNKRVQCDFYTVRMRLFSFPSPHSICSHSIDWKDLRMKFPHLLKLILYWLEIVFFFIVAGYENNKSDPPKSYLYRTNWYWAEDEKRL